MLKESFNADLRRLKEKYPESYLTDTFLMYMDALNKSREWIISNPAFSLTPSLAGEIRKNIKARLDGKPAAYITGRKEFYGLEFNVDESVLVPRPETEILVDEIIKDFKGKNAFGLDIGTGSGCIAVSLAVCGGIKTTAVDISKSAAATARLNAVKHNALNKTKILCCGLFSALKEKKVFDFIVSNPPYLKTAAESLKHEPAGALLAPGHSFYFYGKIIPKSRGYLKEGGALYMEFSFEQADEITSLLKKNGFKNIKIFKDIQNLKRGFKAYV